MFRILLICCFLVFALAPAVAQTEAYTWEPYEFSLMLPDGWVAVEDEIRLVLGFPDDVASVLAGGLASGPVVEVRPIVVSSEGIDDRGGRLYEFVGAERLAPETDPNDLQAILTLDIPATAGRQGRVVLIAQSFLVTASAPTEDWEEFAPMLEALIASIEAQPLYPTRPPPLIQHFTWRDISFDTPRDYLLFSLGDQFEVGVMTRRNNAEFASTFELAELALSVRDYSYIRSLLTVESLPHLRGGFYYGDDILTDITVLAINGLTVGTAEIQRDSDIVGQIALLLSPSDAYLLAGRASSQRWAESEHMLYESILATVRIE